RSVRILLPGDRSSGRRDGAHSATRIESLVRLGTKGPCAHRPQNRAAVPTGGPHCCEGRQGRRRSPRTRLRFGRCGREVEKNGKIETGRASRRVKNQSPIPRQGKPG